MSNHVTKIVGSDEAWQGRCSCRMQSPVLPHRWEADDWTRAHLTTVERVRVHLRDRTPSLKDQRDYFRKQASRATDETIKRQWNELADGLDHRIGTMPQHDETLW